MGITETDLYEGLQSMNVGENRYNIWRRTRSTKKGRGVMLLVKKELQVDEIIYGKGIGEVLKVGLRSKGEGKKDFTVVYVPPKMCSGAADEYEKNVDDTRECS